MIALKRKLASGRDTARIIPKIFLLSFDSFDLLKDRSKLLITRPIKATGWGSHLGSPMIKSSRKSAIKAKGAISKAVMSTEDLDPQSLAKKAKASRGLVGVDLVKDVTYAQPLNWCEEGKYNVVVYDCGLKYNILRELANAGCRTSDQRMLPFERYQVVQAR